MRNEEIYIKNPKQQVMLNEGVANVTKDGKDLEVLRYELNTFVCTGRYRQGLERILDSFLSNLNKSDQPAVWISGFYGSGKSHLLKVLRALWENTAFSDGSTARGIANVGEDIQAKLRELSNLGKRYGGLRAVSGAISSQNQASINLALLAIIFKSVGLPEQYHQAKFVLWLKQSGFYESVKNYVISQNKSWENEIKNFIVSRPIHEALIQVSPEVFPNSQACRDLLKTQFTVPKNISDDEMISTIKETLSVDGKMPLMLIALDEVQQYIADNAERSIQVQMLVEACSKGLDGKVLIVATGQTAITGTSHLKKLEGRFRVRVDLMDTDVDDVIRKILLAKTPEAVPEIQKIWNENSGELSRHLIGTSLQTVSEDKDTFVQDYPILPVRRRFWEQALRAVDATGTDSQLRNQLTMIRDVIKNEKNLHARLGTVIPADAIYFEQANSMLQSHVLSADIYNQTLTLYEGSESDRLTARAVALIFLINKLSQTPIGIHADADTIADLMLENLAEGSQTLRSQIPGLLEQCSLVMRIQNEYHIQTNESRSWHDDYCRYIGELTGQSAVLDAVKAEKFKQVFDKAVDKLSTLQGESKIQREVSKSFSAEKPANEDKITVWVQAGWETDKNSVMVEARQAGEKSSLIFVFVPDCDGELLPAIKAFKAAQMTLDQRGVANTIEAKEARNAMETTLQQNEQKIYELLSASMQQAVVIQAGGTIIDEGNLKQSLSKAIDNALIRMYTKFPVADDKNWGKVYEAAKKGSPNPLKSLAHAFDEDIEKHPVCKEIIHYATQMRKGSEIREFFTDPPYGWSQDAVDAALQALVNAKILLAYNERKLALPNSIVDRKQIAKTYYKTEQITISAPQKILFLKLMNQTGGTPMKDDLPGCVPQWLQQMTELARQAGGDAPLPEPVDTSVLRTLRDFSGNALVLAIVENAQILEASYKSWSQTAANIAVRKPQFDTLLRLSHQARTIQSSEIEEIQNQIQSIIAHRQLLLEPNPIEPLVQRLTQCLRETLNAYHADYQAAYRAGQERLKSDQSFKTLTPDEKHALLDEEKLTESAQPAIDVQSTDTILRSLDNMPLSQFADRIDSLAARFARVSQKAAEHAEPELRHVEIPHRVLKTPQDVEKYVQELRDVLLADIHDGPVLI